MKFDQLLDTAIQLLMQLKEVTNSATCYEDIHDLAAQLLEIVKKMDEFPQELQLRILHAYANELDVFRKVYQDAKFEEEMFFAKDILSGKKEITDFAYERYNKLVYSNLELSYHHMKFDKETPKRMLFAGTGPVPLSAILFAQNDPSLQIDVLDRSEEALELAKQVIKKYGFEDKVRVLNAIPFEKCVTLADYDLIWAASMLGSTSVEKYNVFHELASRLESGKIIFSRTSRKDSMFEMLHVLFPLEKLKEYYELIEYKANEKPAVNASLVLRKI